MKNEFQRRQAVFGCIFGQAIGDAIGHPVEFDHSFGKHVPDLRKGGQFTDDTQMMAAIAEALLIAPPQSVGSEAFMVELGHQFARWYEQPLGGSHRSPGGACSSGARSLGAGIGWAKSGGTASKGNGSAMRSSVVGAFFHQNLNLAWSVGCLTSVPTHFNLEPILCAGAIALLTASACQGIPFAVAMADLLYRIERWEETVPLYPMQVKVGSAYIDQNPWYTATHLAAAFALGRQSDTEGEFYRRNGDDFATVPATAAAIYYNTRYSDFRRVVMRCAANTADADTTTAMAGAIAGARFGYNMIPGAWRKDVELADYFEGLAERIWVASQKVDPPDTSSAQPRTQ